MGRLGGEKEELLIEKQHLVELVADLWKDLDYREEVVRMKPDEVEMADDVEMNLEEDFEFSEEVDGQVERITAAITSTPTVRSILSLGSTVRKSGRVTSLNLQRRAEKKCGEQKA